MPISHAVVTVLCSVIMAFQGSTHLLEIHPSTYCFFNADRRNQCLICKLYFIVRMKLYKSSVLVQDYPMLKKMTIRNTCNLGKQNCNSYHLISTIH